MKFWNYRFFVSWRSIFLWLVSCCCLKFFLNKCSASTTESTIPFAKKFSWYKKKNMADRISIYKAKTNSFFEDIYVYLEFRSWRLSERRLDICIFQITLVSLQIMPGKGLPYWKIHESDLVNLYLVTIWQKSGNFKISSVNSNVATINPFMNIANSHHVAICVLIKLDPI